MHDSDVLIQVGAALIKDDSQLSKIISILTWQTPYAYFNLIL